jgi:coenzyme F420 hydrogenase subunit beta
MRSFGPKELVEDVFQKDLCVGCGACVELCPYFRSHKGKTAMLFPCDLTEGRCYAHCPKAEVDLDALAERWWGKTYEGSPLGHCLTVVKARAGQRAPAALFQAGGTVSSLISFALDRGIIDASVLTDRENLVPVPCLVSRAEDVSACATSKFTAAPTLSALNRAEQEGYTNIGVVGTPCQATAVAQMRANPFGKPDFRDPVALVVGLFCTWALDTRNLLEFLSTRLDLRRVRKMDIPPPPAEVLVIETDQGSVEIPLSEIRPMVPRGCTVCPDMTAEWADLSVGIMEGDPRWNTLIVRTVRGQALVDRASAAGWLFCEAIPSENLAHLRFAAANKKKRTLRAALQQGLVNAQGRSCLRINSAAMEKILAGRVEE